MTPGGPQNAGDIGRGGRATWGGLGTLECQEAGPRGGGVSDTWAKAVGVGTGAPTEAAEMWGPGHRPDPTAPRAEQCERARSVGAAPGGQQAVLLGPAQWRTGEQAVAAASAP